MGSRIEWTILGKKGGKCEHCDNIYVKFLKPADSDFNDMLFFLYEDSPSEEATLKGFIMYRGNKAEGFQKGSVILSEVDPKPIPGFLLRIKKSALLRAKMHFEPRKGRAVSKAIAMEFILSSGRHISFIPDDECFGGLAMILHWNNIKVESKDPSFKLRFFILQNTSNSVDPQKMPGLDRVNLLISQKTKYLIARSVAKGGFGKVHIALDLKSKQPRAVKIFSTYKKKYFFKTYH